MQRFFKQSHTNDNRGLRVFLDTGFDMIAPKLKNLKTDQLGNTNGGNIRDEETSITKKIF